MRSILVALVFIAASTAQRDFPTTRFYTPDGKSAGSATTYGDTTKFYDSRGNLIGTSRKENKK
jgi:hypothetical protein